MNTKWIADYFAFTKKERTGIVLLICIILALSITPYFFKQIKKKENTKLSNTITVQLANLKITKDTTSSFSGKRSFYQNDFSENNFRDYNPQYKVYDKQVKGELFYFDPNTLTADGWQKLGVSEKTANTILNYTSKGGQFRTAEDIGKIYGLSDYMVERLMPFVKINSIQQNAKNYTSYTEQNSIQPNTNSSNNLPKEKSQSDFLTTYKIDINTADTTAWKALPGIGSKISQRIISYKNKLGGFQNIQQVAEIYGLADSTFQKIKNNLTCSPNGINKININSASAEMLRHPYIDKSLANNIIQYRNQHGKYNSLMDLKKLALMDENLFQKILPYITIE